MVRQMQSHHISLKYSTPPGLLGYKQLNELWVHIPISFDQRISYPSYISCYSCLIALVYNILGRIKICYVKNFTQTCIRKQTL